ncbi:MAG: hypothetical protein JWP69_521 [Flaviaesturariibacter sp.]|nr:hypothetical protein [Flaviaesturariibacter sp.]
MPKPSRHILFIPAILCLLISFTGFASPIKKEPPVKFPVITLQTLPGADSLSCIIPFSRAGNLILIKAKADTTVGNFILDSGAPNLVLNLTYFRDYPTTHFSDGEQTNITGSTAPMLKTMVSKFELGTLSYSRLDADLANLGHLENTKRVKILGLLGMELFRQCEMIIDYEKSLIYLHRIGRKEASSYQSPQLSNTADYSVMPIELKDNRIITRIELGGKKLRFIIDCGAESNVLDSRLPNAVFSKVTITGRVMLTGAGNKKVEALHGNLKDMMVGGQVIGSLPVLVTNLEKTCFAYSGCVDGILGFDFLSLHKIGFNFVTRKMYIWK